MPGLPYHLSVESVRWREALPSLHLFDAFRLAVHPAKMMLAFVLVALLYLGGLGFDAIWEDDPFTKSLGIVQRHFALLLDAALRLDLGLSASPGPGDGGVLGALLGLFITVPSLLWRNFPWFLVVYLLYAFALVALFGGAISRMAALQACRELRQSPVAALRYAGERYVWYALAPLLPLATVGLVALVLGLAGLVFFNLPGLDILGGLVFGVLLLLGFVVTLALLGFVVGVHLLYPAISVDGADAFDAISRAYNYVLGRLGRFFLYAVASIIYFALTYLVVALVVYGSLWFTDALLGWGSFTDATTPPDRYASILSGNGGGTIEVAAWLVGFWRTALLLLLPAYVVSFYFSASTWVYLLLRRSTDEVHFDEMHLPEPTSALPATGDSPAVSDAAASPEPAAAPPTAADDTASPATP